MKQDGSQLATLGSQLRTVRNKAKAAAAVYGIPHRQFRDERRWIRAFWWRHRKFHGTSGLL